MTGFRDVPGSCGADPIAGLTNLATASGLTLARLK
jgi:hypothetical protein